MINQAHSKNPAWNLGSVVKVGWLTLRVTGFRAVRDFLPDIYSLESLDGTRQYEFVPHHGLTRMQ